MERELLLVVTGGLTTPIITIKHLRGLNRWAVTDRDILISTRGPWVMKYSGTRDSFMRYVNKIKREDHNSCIFVMHGRAMKSLDGLYDEFIGVMDFPDYFGRNYNALSECLSDLARLDCSAFIVFVDDVSLALSEEKEKEEMLDGLLRIFNQVGREWSKPVSLGEEWDRSGIPFHTILQVNSNDSSRIQSLPDLEALG